MKTAMRRARQAPLLQAVLAGAALFSSVLYVCAGRPATALSDSGKSDTPKSDSKWAGTYESDPPKDGKGPSMSVSLGADGSATVSQDYGKGVVTSFGHWAESGSQITVTFDAVPGRPTPAPMNFSTGHDALQATTWDHSAWGNVTPPPMKRGANWHAKGKHSWL